MSPARTGAHRRPRPERIDLDATAWLELYPGAVPDPEGAWLARLNAERDDTPSIVVTSRTLRQTLKALRA